MNEGPVRRDGSAHAIGIDVGGTRTAVVRIAADGAVLAREARPTPADDQEATIVGMIAAAGVVMSDDVAAVGISAAGLVDLGGVMRFAPNLAWRDTDLVGRVGSSLGLPATADNDNTAAAWGEFRLGSGRGCRHMLLVGVGTGIGGGIVADGRLFRGAHGFAAEIGHVIVEPGGPLCGCGNHGCWEQVASGTTITRQGRASVHRHPHSLIAELVHGDVDAVTGELVSEAARQGDPTARGILMEVGHRLGEGVAGLVNILDPEIVVIGGGASEAGDLLLEPARASFRRSVMAYDRRPDVPLRNAALGNDAGAIGAALLALDEVT
jgi:glucokinase